MENIKSSMKFINYVVHSVEFTNNPDFEGEDTSLDFEPTVDFEIQDNNLLVFLSIHVFKDAEKHNYPFEMKVSVVGHFKVSNKENVEKYKPNAVAVLFPYIRSLISTYTAAANVNPLILPTVNINRMLANKNDK